MTSSASSHVQGVQHATIAEASLAIQLRAVEEILDSFGPLTASLRAAAAANPKTPAYMSAYASLMALMMNAQKISQVATAACTTLTLSSTSGEHTSPLRSSHAEGAGQVLQAGHPILSRAPESVSRLADGPAEAKNSEDPRVHLAEVKLASASKVQALLQRRMMACEVKLTESESKLGVATAAKNQAEIRLASLAAAAASRPITASVEELCVARMEIQFLKAELLAQKDARNKLESRCAAAVATASSICTDVSGLSPVMEYNLIQGTNINYQYHHPHASATFSFLA